MSDDPTLDAAYDLATTAQQYADRVRHLERLLARYVAHVENEESVNYLDHEPRGHYYAYEFPEEERIEVAAIWAKHFPEEYARTVAWMEEREAVAAAPPSAPVAPRLPTMMVEATEEEKPVLTRPMRRPKGGPWGGRVIVEGPG